MLRKRIAYRGKNFWSGMRFNQADVVETWRRIACFYDPAAGDPGAYSRPGTALADLPLDYP